MIGPVRHNCGPAARFRRDEPIGARRRRGVRSSSWRSDTGGQGQGGFTSDTPNQSGNGWWRGSRAQTMDGERRRSSPRSHSAVVPYCLAGSLYYPPMAAVGGMAMTAESGPNGKIVASSISKRGRCSFQLELLNGAPPECYCIGGGSDHWGKHQPQSLRAPL